MLEINRCRTKTAKALEPDERIQHQREHLKQKLSTYTQESMYQTLCQGRSFVTLDQREPTFSVEMKRSMLGLYLVPVKIKGETYRFVIDTGAQISSVRSQLIVKHGCRQLPGSLSIGSVGGTEKPLHGFEIEELQLGALWIHKLPMVALDAAQFQFNLGQVDISLFDGILGWDVLSQLNFELDDVAKKFIVCENHFRFPQPNMVKTMFPILVLKDDRDHILTMGLDSGARYGWMGEEAMIRLGYAMSEEAGVLGYGVHGLEELQVKLIPEISFHLDRAHIRVRKMHTGRTNIFPDVSLDGILGNEIFRNRRIRFINQKEMLLLV